VHLIADNATHKDVAVRTWLARRPRLVVHFTPTGSSWLNLVERFFAELIGDVIRDGSVTMPAGLFHRFADSPRQRLAERRIDELMPWHWIPKQTPSIGETTKSSELFLRSSDPDEPPDVIFGSDRAGLRLRRVRRTWQRRLTERQHFHWRS
jgi:hypothetical protein